MRRESATRGFAWKTFEQFGVMAIQFVLQLVLARILMPEAYGVVAIVTIFSSFINIIMQCGLSSALVQKKQITDIEISSIFNISFLVGVFLYVALFLLSPFIAIFFKMDDLKVLLRVLSISVFPGLFSSVQTALLRRKLQFKAVFFASLISVSLSGVIGIVMANYGYGAWALVGQQLSYGISFSAILFMWERWYPKFVLDIKCVKPLFQYGWKVLLTNLIDDFVINLRSFVIGRKYDANSLAFFNRGKSFPDLLIRSINGSMQAVLLPVLSLEQDNEVRMRELVRICISVSTFAIYPLLTLMAFCAPTLIPFLLTEKWMPAVVYLQIFCLYYASWPITTSNIEALYAKGASGLVLKLETIRKIVDVLILCISMHFGMDGIAWGVAVVSILSVPLYLLPAQRQIGYSIGRQLRDISANIFISLILGVYVYFLNRLPYSGFYILLIQMISGLGLYLGLAYLFKIVSLQLLITYLKALHK